VLEKLLINGKRIALDNYQMPPSGPSAEKDSFKCHMGIAKEYEEILSNPDKIPVSLDAIHWMTDKTRCGMRESEFEFSWNRVLADAELSILGAKPHSSPGVPYCYYYQSNKQMIEGVGMYDMICLVVSRYYDRWLGYEIIRKLGIDSVSPETLVLLNSADPIRVFIKREPHKLKKVKQKRWRNIWSVSLVDGCCDEISYWPDKRHIDNWQHVPMKPGAPLGDSGDLPICRELLSAGVDIESNDAQNWDMLCRIGLWRAVGCVRAGWAVDRSEVEKLYYEPFSSDNPYVQQVMMSLYMQMYKMLVFSDGDAVAISGFYEPSGARGTASNNSIGRGLVHVHVALDFGINPEPFVTYGDDFAGRFIQGETERLKQMGHAIKDDSIVVSRDSFEFCSRKYWRDEEGGYRSAFLGVEKTLVNYVHQSNLPERRGALVLELGPLGRYLENILPSFTGGH